MAVVPGEKRRRKARMRGIDPRLWHAVSIPEVGRAPAGRRDSAWVGATKPGKPAPSLTFDQGFQGRADEIGCPRDAGVLLRASEQIVVKSDRDTHGNNSLLREFHHKKTAAILARVLFATVVPLVFWKCMEKFGHLVQSAVPSRPVNMYR
jgi:hypothetical protein